MNAAKWQEQMDNAAGRDAFKVPPAVEFVEDLMHQGWTARPHFWQNGKWAKDTWPLFLDWEGLRKSPVSDIEAFDCKNFGRYMLMMRSHNVGDSWEVMDGDTPNYFTTSEMYSFFKQNKRPS